MSIGLDVIVGAIIEGIAGSLTEKAAEATPRVAKRIDTLLIEQRPLSELGQKIQQAVDEARKEMLDEYFAQEGDLARDVIKLFEKYSTFAEGAMRQLFRGGTIDFDRLRQVYLDREPGATSARWQTLEEPLLAFFNAIERRLTFEPTVGPILTELKELAVLTRLDQTQQIIADSIRQVERYNERMVGNGDESVVSLQRLFEINQRQDARLGELVQLLTQQAITAPGEPPTPSPVARLTTAETTYLRRLRDECNKLPLAHEARSLGDRRQRSAQLDNVYVDLQTTQTPSLETVLDRLAVPATSRHELLKQLNQQSVAKESRAGRLAVLGDAQMEINDIQLLKVQSGEKIRQPPAETLGKG